ncbi:MAG: NAD(P)-dependent glycerol-3-phosphate dehydrogenase [Opitutales bacterium]|nr:NAD(P)-dependent glycerol-3-phosphate dehydrogenase [Opitutales bacterium]
MNFCVLGAGAWGTAMAVYLSRCGHSVSLIPRRVEHALTLSSERQNQDYLPGISFDEDLQIGCSLRPVLMESEYLFFACPSHALRETCKQVSLFREDSWNLKGGIALCKGLEPKSNLFAHEVIQEELGSDIGSGYLTGPSHAHDVAVNKPTAMVLTMDCAETELIQLQSNLSSKTMRIYRSEDRVGVALGSCLKNVYAIATGLSDGLGLGDNARAALLTRSMNEMIDLGISLGGESETFFGLSGFGDLIGTCMGEWSRNRRFGLALAKGGTPKDIISTQKTVVEGYWATGCFFEKCGSQGVEMPILREIYGILYEGKDPYLALSDLMSRGLKAESLRE